MRNISIGIHFLPSFKSLEFHIIHSGFFLFFFFIWHAMRRIFPVRNKSWKSVNVNVFFSFCGFLSIPLDFHTRGRTRMFMNCPSAHTHSRVIHLGVAFAQLVNTNSLPTAYFIHNPLLCSTRTYIFYNIYTHITHVSHSRVYYIMHMHTCAAIALHGYWNCGPVTSGVNTNSAWIVLMFWNVSHLNQIYPTIIYHDDNYLQHVIQRINYHFNVKIIFLKTLR
jgi:hypothetical protein